jgi:hypothetical protein
MGWEEEEVEEERRRWRRRKEGRSRTCGHGAVAVGL